MQNKMRNGPFKSHLFSDSTQTEQIPGGNAVHQYSSYLQRKNQRFPPAACGGLGSASSCTDQYKKNLRTAALYRLYSPTFGNIHYCIPLNS
ncbi:unnamed protein product [Arctogadus glacialis]